MATAVASKRSAPDNVDQVATKRPKTLHGVDASSEENKGEDPQGSNVENSSVAIASPRLAHIVCNVHVARPADLAVCIRDIEAIDSGFKHNLDVINEVFEDGRLLVALEGDQVRGMIIASYSGSPVILYVLEAFRHRGVGTILADFVDAQSHAVGRPMHQVTAVGCSDGFWIRRGFTSVDDARDNMRVLTGGGRDRDDYGNTIHGMDTMVRVSIVKRIEVDDDNLLKETVTPIPMSAQDIVACTGALDFKATQAQEQIPCTLEDGQRVDLAATVFGYGLQPPDITPLIVERGTYVATAKVIRPDCTLILPMPAEAETSDHVFVAVWARPTNPLGPWQLMALQKPARLGQGVVAFAGGVLVGSVPTNRDFYPIAYAGAAWLRPNVVASMNVACPGITVAMSSR